MHHRFRGLLFSFLFAFIPVALLLICGCANQFAANPLILTLWHNYGGQLKETMDEIIDKFNETAGAENGIIINVTAISGSATINEKLAMAAGGEPGAPALPDITTAYPKSALLLAEKGLLVDLDQHFTVEELSAFVPQFLEEGRLGGGELFVFPVAKSTEVLFVNTTIFNRFAADTGAKLADLQTFEGIARTAASYYEWTDGQTPAANDGKMFFMLDSLFNYTLIGCKQLGGELFHDGTIDFKAPHFSRVWEYFFKPAVLGHAAIFDGYATDLAKTGDIVCSIGSTAGVSFFSPIVTYADNTSEPAQLAIMPYPVFEGGEKIALQRGAGMSVIKSTAERESAAAVFIKWFTSPENNLHFVSRTGYLPVTMEAFGELMEHEIAQISDEKIKKLLQTCRLMQEEYDFCIAPLFEGIDEWQAQYEKRFKEIAAASREAYREQLMNGDSTRVRVFESVSSRAFDAFIQGFNR